METLKFIYILETLKFIYIITLSTKNKIKSKWEKKNME